MQAFQKAAQAAGFSLTVLPRSDLQSNATLSQAALKAVVGECEYFLATLPDGSRMVRPIMRGGRVSMPDLLFSCSQCSLCVCVLGGGGGFQHIQSSCDTPKHL